MSVAISGGHWLALAVLVGAACTLLLAAATWRVARRAVEVADGVRREAEAVVDQAEQIQAQTEAIRDQTRAVTALAEVATSQVELSTQALRSSARPWLTVAGAGRMQELQTKRRHKHHRRSVWIADDDASITAGVRVRNVGNGLAIVHADESVILGWRANPDVVHGPLEFTSAVVARPVLRPGEETDVVFTVRRTSARWSVDLETFTNQTIGKVPGTSGHFFVDVVYSDARNDEMIRARFHLTHSSQGRWSPAGIDYFVPPGATHAEASTRFR
jgi:gas vesicle protein